MRGTGIGIVTRTNGDCPKSIIGEVTHIKCVSSHKFEEQIRGTGNKSALCFAGVLAIDVDASMGGYLCLKL